MSNTYMSERALPERINERVKILAKLIGGNVKRLREEKNWDRLDLSFYAYMSDKTVERIEAGEDYNPTMRTMISLSIAFGVPIELLLEERRKLCEAEEVR